MTLPGKLRAIRRTPVLARSIIVASCILVSAALVAPFYYVKPPGSGPNEIRYAHDLTIHLAVIEQFDKMLKSGTIYPRWLPDVNYGYGNAWPNFYPPGFYYAASLINAIADNWINTLFVITTLGLAASSLAFYVFARTFFGKAASAIAAVLYALLPYHLIDFFWRGAMPEFLCFVVLPLILLFLVRVGRNEGVRSYAGLGLFYGLSLMLHTPIAYLFSYLLLLYAIAWAWQARDWRIAGRIFLGMTVGVFLSAIYWLPAVVEIKYAVETVTVLFQYHRNYVDQLSSEGVYERLLRETFAIQSIAVLVVIAVSRLLEWRRVGASQASQDSPKSAHISIWIGLGMLAAFMNLQYSYSVSRLIPKIEIVAFPSRWLAFVSLFSALLTGAAADFLINGRAQIRNARIAYSVATAAIVGVIFSNLWFGAQAVVMGSRSNPMVSPYSEFLCDTYCPKGAGPAAKLPRTEALTVEPKTERLELVRWKPLHREAVITAEEPSVVRFRTFNFPGWIAKVDGQPVPIASDAAKAQLISVPSGNHTIEVTFSGTLARDIGACLSALSGITISLIVATDLFGLSLLRKTRRVAHEHSPAEPGRSGNAAVPPAFSFGGLKFQHISKPPGATRLVLNLCVVSLILGGVVFCARMLIDDSHLLDQPAKQNYVPRPRLGEGSDATLQAGQTDVTVASDERSLSEVLTAIAKRDDHALDSLLQSGRSFRVAQNVKARILKLAGGKAKVAILEGDNSSREGWVLEAWLK